MIAKSIPLSWLVDEERRLDCGPFVKGSVETKVALQNVKLNKSKLVDLTLGGLDGIYHVGQEKINWVYSDEYGIPFLRSSDVLKVGVSKKSLISKDQVRNNQLFKAHTGSTLITRSGTIGLMAYCRAEMSDTAMSQDILKVTPDISKVMPGYIYSFLSSKFGIPLVVGGTFGSIIVHIEAENIADIPVPRLGSREEREIHDLVEEASRLRSESSKTKNEVISRISRMTRIGNSSSANTLCSVVSSARLGRRMDAFHFSASVNDARELLGNNKFSRKLGDLVDDIFEPGRSSRIKVDSLDYGIPFLSSSEVFKLDPKGEYLISKNKTRNLGGLLLFDRDLLIPRSGQVGGIIGRAVLPMTTNYGDAASEHLVRIRCKNKDDAFYLWAVLIMDAGYKAIIGTAYGSSIPSLDCDMLKEIKVPWLDDENRQIITVLVEKYVSALGKAIKLDREAVRLTEYYIDKAV